MDKVRHTTIAPVCKSETSTGSLPAPLIDSAVVFKNLPSFMLNAVDVLTNRARLSSGEFKAALCLICHAWLSSPPGSIPDDEEQLAWMSNEKTWRKVRDKVLAEWVRCSDGRLYHPVLCEDVKRAIKSLKRTEKARSEKARKKASSVHHGYSNGAIEADDDIPF